MRTLAVVLSALVLLCAWQASPVRSVGTVTNGDTNGDGTIDVSDAIYTLVYLFRDGNPPVSCAAGVELEERVARLEAELSAIRGVSTQEAEILGHMSIEYLPIDEEGSTAKTIRITGTNLQLFAGTPGDEWKPGLGNLIIGDNFERSEIHDEGPVPEWRTQRTGQHNLILGYHQNYTSFGGIVTGIGNTSEGGSVIGGVRNSAIGTTSVVIGGEENRAWENGSCIVGGDRNYTGGTNSVIIAGNDNETWGFDSVVVGGYSSSSIGVSSCVVCGVEHP